MDFALNNFFIENRNDFLNVFFKTITYFGDVHIVFPICVILTIYFYKYYRHYLLYFFLTCFASVFITVLLKHIVKRIRPTNQLILETGYSFPSGHATIAMAFYGFLIYILHKENKHKILIISCAILILLIGLSRVYLGVHYFTDVLCGWTIGLIALYFILKKSK